MIYYNFLAVLFALSEIALLVRKRSKTDSAKVQQDGKSMLWLWIVIFGGLTAGYLISSRKIGLSGNPTIMITIGIAVFLIGFIFRWIAIYQLGSMFTVDVSISNDHILKTDGLYKIVRHPSYLGLLLIIVGLALLMNNLFSAIVIIIPVFVVINYRMAVEEKALKSEFGSQYEQYSLAVKRIIPFIY